MLIQSICKSIQIFWSIAIKKRNNEIWRMNLRGSGPEQQQALSDLRSLLLRNLRGAFSSNTSIDNAFLEDIIQDSIIRILDRLSQFEGRSQFMTWTTSIAIRNAMSELRHRRWKDVSLDDVIADSDFNIERIVDDGVGPSIQKEQEEIIKTMHTLIQNNLSEKQRLALLAELKGMPQDEIARHIGNNRNALYKLTHDARKRLKQELEAVGYSTTDIHESFAN